MGILGGPPPLASRLSSLVYGNVTMRHPERVFSASKTRKSPTVFRGYWCPRADEAAALWIALHNLAVAWQQEMAF